MESRIILWRMDIRCIYIGGIANTRRESVRQNKKITRELSIIVQ